MKIYGNQPPDKSSAPDKAGKARKKGDVQKSNAAGIETSIDKVDKVNLSPVARDVSQIRAAVNGLPEVREEKVQNIKDSIDKGTYKVEPEKIAGKMLEELA
jgi:negative regulator of flagellin synthesis FlgM